MLNIVDFGATPGDEKLASTNVRAIQLCIDSAATARPLEQPTVLVPAGRFYVNKSIRLRRYTSILGQGPSSILSCSGNGGWLEGASVLELDARQTNSILLKDFSIYGDREIGHTVCGISSTAPERSYYVRFSGLYIKEMSGCGIELSAGGTEIHNSLIESCIVRDCLRHNMYLKGAERLIISGCRVRSAKERHSGLVLDHGCHDIIINACAFDQNAEHGVWISDSSERVVVTACSLSGNGKFGLFMDRVSRCTLTSSMLWMNGQGPFHHEDSHYLILSDNIVS